MKKKQDLLKSLQQFSVDEKMEQFQIEELETRLEMASAGELGAGTGDNGTCNGTCTNNGCNDGCW